MSRTICPRKVFGTICLYENWKTDYKQAARDDLSILWYVMGILNASSIDRGNPYQHIRVHTTRKVQSRLHSSSEYGQAAPGHWDSSRKVLGGRYVNFVGKHSKLGFKNGNNYCVGIVFSALFASYNPAII